MPAAWLSTLPLLARLAPSCPSPRIADAPSFANRAHATCLAADADTGYASGLGNTGAQGAGGRCALATGGGRRRTCFETLPGLLWSTGDSCCRPSAMSGGSLAQRWRCRVACCPAQLPPALTCPPAPPASTLPCHALPVAAGVQAGASCHCPCAPPCLAMRGLPSLPLCQPLACRCSAETAHLATGGKAGMYSPEEHVDP